MMWFVTKAGPAFYNANSWFSFPDSLDLPSSDNSKIVIENGIVWVAGLNKTAFTIQHYSGVWSKLEFPFKSTDFTRHIAFNVFSSGGKSFVILGVNRTLYICDVEKESWEKIDLENTIYSIHSINDAQILCTSNGLFEMKDGRIEPLQLPYHQLPNRQILTLDFKNDTYHLLGYNWYAEVKEDQVVYFLNDVGLVNTSTSNQSSIVVDEGGKIFYGASTPARMISKKDNSWQNLLINGNQNIGSTRIFCDQENNIWVSDSRGLFKFNVLKFLNYNKKSGLADNEVTAITQLRSGKIILANQFDFNVLEKNIINQYTYKKDKDLTFRILAVEEDTINNLVYMSTHEAGLLAYQIDRYGAPLRVYDNEKLRMTAVESFNGKIYAAGNQGIFSIEDGKLEKLKSNNRIRNIVNLGKRLAFLSNDDGVYMFNGDTFTQYTSTNLDLKSVYQAVIFESDTLLATRDGVGVIRSGEIQHWEKDSIQSPTYGLLVDSKNKLWIGGDQGVYLFDGESLQQFNLDEGLSGNEINRNALYEDNSGQIWVGTEGGVSVFFKSSESEKKLNLDVNITDVLTEQGYELSYYTNNKLPYKHNDLSISFQCLSYFDEDKMNFRYRINDDSKWIHKSDLSNRINLINLESGDYNFKIQARYGSSEWGPISSFNFTIKKPFFARWWFIILVAVFLTLSARIIFHFRYLYLIRKQRNLKKLVAERTREVTLLNRQLEEKVRQRTKELNDKNLRLEESAFMNAHHLRGPLTKIMSALQIAELEGDDLINKEIYNILKEAVSELDAVIFSINDILSKD